MTSEKDKFEEIKVVIRSVNQRRTDNGKQIKDNSQHRKLNSVQHDPTQTCSTRDTCRVTHVITAQKTK